MSEEKLKQLPMFMIIPKRFFVSTTQPCAAGALEGHTLVAALRCNGHARRALLQGCAIEKGREQSMPSSRRCRTTNRLCRRTGHGAVSILGC
jgi:hypothetical protein